MMPIFSFACLLPVCRCILVFLHAVMVRYWPFFIFRPQNVDLFLWAWCVRLSFIIATWSYAPQSNSQEAVV